MCPKEWQRFTKLPLAIKKQIIGQIEIEINNNLIESLHTAEHRLVNPVVCAMPSLTKKLDAISLSSNHEIIFPCFFKNAYKCQIHELIST
jgi:hypothetical protein